MTPDQPAAPLAEHPAASSGEELTDDELNTVVGGVDGLVHETTHTSSTTTGGTTTSTVGRFQLDIGKYNVGYMK